MLNAVLVLPVHFFLPRGKVALARSRLSRVGAAKRTFYLRSVVFFPDIPTALPLRVPGDDNTFWSFVED